MAKPKVISLLKTDKINNLFLKVPMVGRPADVFVLCTSYDLKLPVNSQETRALDIFEETILRMLKVKKCTASELADILCLEKDLVNFILIRLQEKRLLEDKYTLSEEGKQLLNFQKSLREKVEYQTAKLFLVKGCDIVLPYIHVGSFLSEDVIEFGPSSITLGFGSIGDQKKVAGSCIRGKGGNRLAVLPQVTVKNAIKKYNRLAEKRKKDPIVLAEEYGIESSCGEELYFHMQMAVQEGNAEELLVSDGFVSNIDGLFGYIRTVDPDLAMRVQSKAVRMDVGEKQAGENDQRMNPGKYPEVVRYCRDMDQYVRKISETSSLDDIRQNNEEKRQAIIHCYSMLEWTFHYVSLKTPISDSLLQVLKQQRSYENFDTIKNLARKLGIGYLGECSALLTNFDGRRAELFYRDFGKTTPNMQIVLPLSIIAASENDDSELRDLIASDHRFLSFLGYVGKMAADFRHDSTVTAGEVKVEEIRNHAVAIVTVLLPDIQLGKSEARATDHVSNERLKAIVACEKALGSLLYSSLPEGVQADLRWISPDKKQAQLPAPYEYVQVLYRILQTMFYEEGKRYGTKNWLPKEACIKKNEELFGKVLPKALATVNTARYNAAAKGLKVTLGVHFLVLMPNLPQGDLDLLKAQDIVGTVGSILEYRKHGNDISLMVSEEELSNLRAKVINVIKILGGYYNG